MFCLRSWIPILFFLTNASPVYLILFISATYVLNRPCVYCSLLLFILVIALFDFHTNWFEPPSTNTTPHSSSSSSSSTNHSSHGSSHQHHMFANGTMIPPVASPDAFETASLVASLVNSTASAAVRAVAEEAKRKVAVIGDVGAAGAAAAVDAAKGSWMKREWRVPCLDVLVRL